MSEWITIVCFLLLLFGLIGIAEKLRSLFNYQQEATRKFVHIVTGVLIFFTPYIFSSSKPLIFISVLFIFINFLGIRFGLFKSIHGTERQTYGTVFYPLAFLFLLLLFWENHKVIIQLSMLILSIADALAAIVGNRVKNPHTFNLAGEKKSIEGTTVMAGTSFLIILFGLCLLEPTVAFNLTVAKMVWIAIVASVIATIAETISISGSDNLSAPLGAAFVLHFMLTHGTTGNIQFSIGILLAILVALISYFFRFLDGSGATTTSLLGTIIFGIGGWQWAIPILAFFISSSVLSKIWKDKKDHANVLYEKSSQRDYGQVFANGALPALLILSYYATGDEFLYFIYLGAIAAVTADTWGTEIGTLAKKSPRLITTFHKVTPGTSGAISVLGTTGSLLGSLFIALIGYGIQPLLVTDFILSIVSVTFAGLSASFVDSLLGATIQSQYKCSICQKVTEKKIHCKKEPTSLERGFVWINNDMVNLFSAIWGMMFMLLIIQFFR